MVLLSKFFFFFFTDPAPTGIYTLSLHDALPISVVAVGDDLSVAVQVAQAVGQLGERDELRAFEDRKSTRLNSSHSSISYAVFCLKKKKTASSNSRVSGRTDTTLEGALAITVSLP